MSVPWRKPLLYSVSAFAVLALLPLAGLSQQYTRSDRDFAQQMLRSVAYDAQKHYYDPKFHGVDWGKRVQQAKENIDKHESMDSAVSEVAALLDSLNDSHTIFILPPRAYDHLYGFKMRMVGDRCY